MSLHGCSGGCGICSRPGTNKPVQVFSARVRRCPNRAIIGSPHSTTGSTQGEDPMTELTRRTVLAGAAAATALPLAAASPAHAAAPPAGKQAPGFYRYKVGSHEVTVVTDGARTQPLPDNFVQNQPKAEVSKAL